MGHSDIATAVLSSLQRSAIRSPVVKLEYRASNGRRFFVRQDSPGQFFVYEETPLGRVSLGVGYACDWPRHKQMMFDPNGYFDALRKDGIPVRAMQFRTPSYSSASRVWSSLDEAAAAIAAALSSNAFYDDIDPSALPGTHLH